VDDAPEATERRLTEHLARQPSLAVAADVLRTPVQRWTEPTLQALRHAVDRAAKPLQRYRCAACGFEAQHYFWQCPGCLGWDSYPPQRAEEP
jgi:lipopolysaccharide biosynthesis regulator YciM